MKAYFIGTFRDLYKDDLGWPQLPGMRVVGYYEDLETARKCIEENWCDLYECGYYKYAVIEDIEPGLYQSTESNPIFFKWEGDEKTGGYKEIERPEILKSTFGFTIG
jgi:hypothetical protein